MNLTEMAPCVLPQNFKRTKIVATVGPAVHSYEAIRDLIQAGVNVIRLNFSHGANPDRLQQIAWARQASAELQKPVAIFQDLQGPKMRLGDFEGQIDVTTGDELRLKFGANYEETGIIPTQLELSDKVKPGEEFSLFDGRVSTTITKVEDGVIYTTAKNSGYLIKRKGMNLPDTDFAGDIMTEKDIADLHFGIDKDFDYVALSFVQKAVDIENLRTRLRDLGSDARIIAKFETKAAVCNMEEIVKAADVIMVARGDLAVETPAESVPVVQRRLTELCRKHATPVIIATQMFLSMMENPQPTRAEVSDAANAVFTGADAVMLSDETAMGKYPLETVKTAKRILLYSEQHPVGAVEMKARSESTVNDAIAMSAINLAENVDAKAIIVLTSGGRTVRQISTHRPTCPIIAVTDTVRVAQQLTMNYGVKSYVRPSEENTAKKITDWLRSNDVLKSDDVVVTVSGTQPGLTGGTDTIRVRTVK